MYKVQNKTLTSNLKNHDHWIFYEYSIIICNLYLQGSLENSVKGPSTLTGFSVTYSKSLLTTFLHVMIHNHPTITNHQTERYTYVHIHTFCHHSLLSLAKPSAQIIPGLPGKQNPVILNSLARSSISLLLILL